MKSLKFLFVVVLIGYLIFFNTSCKKEKCQDPTNPECENYDPCNGEKPVMAEIVLSQRAEPSSSGVLGKLYLNEGGDVFPRMQIRFHCPLEGAKYTWTLGAETITEQTFERNFFTVPYGVYTVKLIVEKTPNTNCYPSDDGFDTVIKTFEIVPVCELETIGTFKGKWDGVPQSDSSVITFRSYRDASYSDSCSFGLPVFTNLQNKRDTLYGAYTYISNKEVVNYHPGHLGIGNLNLNVNPLTKVVVLDYYIGTTHFLFKGRKIAN
ncbi:MAG: hypothetical protein ACO1PI_04470 [Bacteroidota bacterium]